MVVQTNGDRVADLQAIATDQVCDLIADSVELSVSGDPARLSVNDGGTSGVVLSMGGGVKTLAREPLPERGVLHLRFVRHRTPPHLL